MATASMYALGLTAASLGSLWYYYSRPTHNGAPRVPSLPIVGNTLELLNGTYEFFMDKKKKYGEVYVIHLLGSYRYVLSGDDANRWIFKGEGDYLEHSWPYTWAALMGRHALTVAEPQVHQKLRQELLVAFTPKALASYLPHMENLARKHCGRIAERSGGKNPVEACHETKEISLTVALKVFLNEDDARAQVFTKWFLIYLEGFKGVLPWNVPWTAFGKGMRAREKMFDIIREIIREKKTKSHTDDFDFVENFLQKKEGLTEEEILDQILLFLFAGHDTVSSTQSSLFYILGTMPEIVENLRKELDEAFPDPDDHYNYDKLVALPYLDAFVREILRYYTPVSGLPRKVIKDGISYKGYPLPKGTLVSYSTYITHHSSVYADASVFEPKRFLEPRNEEKKVPYTFVPFAAGPHTCLGNNFAKLEMKIVTAVLVQNYDIKVLSSKMSGFPLRREEPTILVSKRAK